MLAPGTILLEGVPSQEIGGVHMDRTPIEFLGEEYPNFSVVRHSAESIMLNV